MWSRTRVVYGAVLAYKPALAVSVESHNTVRRFIGMRSNRVPNMLALQSVLDKTSGAGLAGVAATLYRAYVYLAHHNPAETIAEVERVLPRLRELDADGALEHMAVGLRLRARNDLLDLSEASLTVAGGSSEAEVSSLRTRVREDYRALRALAPSCWLIALAAAEYDLYTGRTAEALDALRDIERRIAAFLAAAPTLREDVATPANTNAHTLLSFELQRTTRARAHDARGSALVREAADALADDAATRRAFAEFKAGLHASTTTATAAAVQLSDEEACEVLFALQNAQVRHHFHDYFPSAGGEYALWPSASSHAAQSLILHAYAQLDAHLDDEAVARVRASTPPSAFYAPSDAMLAVARQAAAGQQQQQKSGEAPVSVVARLREAFGAGPQTPLCAADEAYVAALAQVNAFGASRDTAGTLAYARRQYDVAHVMAQQMLYRVRTQLGVALTEQQRMHEAVDVLTPIVNEDKYIYMWRALLARSRAYKSLGLITLHDKDLKVLHELRRSLTARAPYAMT